MTATMSGKIVVALAAVLLLAGCSTTSVEQLAPSAAPRPTASGAAVPITPGAIEAPRSSVAPVRVQIPSVGVDIPVEPVGVQPSGLMELPPDIRTAGWYKYGPDPESPFGSTVISAHVDSYAQGIGPFAYLKEVPAGASVIVTTADGIDHSYTVASVQKVAKQQLPLDQVFDRTGAPRLVLITCGGQFDRDVLNYTDNLIAIANPS